MKKLFCIVASLVCSVSLVSAQEASFGVKAGVNVSSANVSPGSDYDSKVGMHAGGLVHIHLTRSFALQPEVVFSMQGGKRDEEPTLKLNYVNIPLLVQYMTENGFRLQTGPQLGLLTSAKTKSNDVERNVKENFKTTDFSWAFGAGYLFNSGLGIDARYNLGISSIYDVSDLKVKNNVFQFGLFYQFMQGNAKHK